MIEIRMAFLAPEIMDSVQPAGCSFGFTDLRKISALSLAKTSGRPTFKAFPSPPLLIFPS
jgi:hypothetical protein